MLALGSKVKRRETRTVSHAKICTQSKELGHSVGIALQGRVMQRRPALAV
jgi:hypothetical protein